MKKIISVFCLLIFVVVTQAQDEKGPYIRKGLIRGQATISPGTMLRKSVSTISIHGCLEYHIANNISVRGDSYYFIQGKDGAGVNPFEFNHSIFSGMSYHFKTKSHFDPYLGFEPGISITKLRSYSALIECFTTPCPGDINFHDNTAVNPLLSSVLGFNFYFERWFHLFGEARYIGGKHISNSDFYPISLSELRFSFGLGFNLNLLRKKE